jgi:hypothetical protein
MTDYASTPIAHGGVPFFRERLRNWNFYKVALFSIAFRKCSKG